jgi:hypothetical protein
MSEIQYRNDLTRALEYSEGSDGRLNVSSRTDSRGYYISRDQEQAYSLVFDFQSATATEIGFYLKNISTSHHIVISAIGVNSTEDSKIRLVNVSGTPAAGTAITPSNMNVSSSNAASTTAFEGASAATGITGLSVTSQIDRLRILSGGHQEFRLDDRLRLGQNDAIALQYFEGTTGDFEGVIFFYFEEN